MKFMLCCSFLLLWQILLVFAEDTQYDYIVVGAGTAGSIVATRLSTVGSVLVVDAGDEPPVGSEKIKGYQPLVGNSTYDWLFKTVKQTSLGFPKEITIDVGKILGGTGTINSMIFLRGNKQDYDSWEAQGATGWGWDNNIELIKSIEDSHLQDVEEQWHHTGGPISITNVGKEIPVVKSFVDAVVSQGYKITDPNDGKQTGAAFVPLNFYNDERQSTYRKYLKPYLNDEDYTINLITKAFVEKILFEDENGVKKAVGITYSKDGSLVTVKAKKEVIVCAGTFGSPKLLMLSGIGPRDHLESLGIKVISDLPVGQNLRDHFAVYVPVLGSSTVFDGKDSAVAFVNTEGPEATSKPDIEVEMFLYFNYSLTTTVLLQPQSTGTVTLKSSNPSDPPVIDPKYLSVESDVDTLAKGLKIADDIVQSWNIPSDYFKIPNPYEELPCKAYEYKSHEFWKCVAKFMGSSIFHPVGTCRMGSKSSKTSVVDERLNVIGVKGLRVADASIMPTTTSANPQVTVMFIGEKASSLIIHERE